MTSSAKLSPTVVQGRGDARDSSDLRDGLYFAAGHEVPAPPLKIAFYGDLFFPRSSRNTPTGSEQVDEKGATVEGEVGLDLDEGEVEFVTAAAAEIVGEAAVSDLVVAALCGARCGPYALQAAMAAVHDEAADIATTDWLQVVALYDMLARVSPSPVVELNRAVAMAMRDGPQAGLAALDALDADALRSYHLVPAARADLLRRLRRGLGPRSRMLAAHGLILSQRKRFRDTQRISVLISPCLGRGLQGLNSP